MPRLRVQRAASHVDSVVLKYESGFADWMKAQPDGAKKLNALLSLDKKKLIDGVLKSGFTFAGYVPSVVNADLAEKH